ncbi:MAG: bifunctional methylenetetrahydrofolate dehydrogenase/methenyltetrahydrofolate cyclohydrolase FolD [Eubacteriales bacterium]|nr:bifunctional methylenetetrahydrofolate dehydrogenase/methenyltetrahydrofolate cyclohydrolase FolD [Eubacteriales bacterium]
MILDGKALSTKVKDRVKQEISNLHKNDNIPTLAVVLVGDDPASAIYVRNKKRACEYVGIKSVSVTLGQDTTQEKLEQTLNDLNNDKSINGILLQLPLPKGLNERKALNCIAPEKDVDGLSSVNLGKLITKEVGITPCTPTGVMEFFKEYNIDLTGKNVVIINRSILVGKPLALMMLNANATVTICHSKTQNISEYTKKADVIVTAVGKAKFLTEDMVKDGAVVIDVSIVRTEAGLCGDADYENIKDKASYITPVPGGVGPMTIAMLMENTLKAYKLQNNI